MRELFAIRPRVHGSGAVCSIGSAYQRQNEGESGADPLGLCKWYDGQQRFLDEGIASVQHGFIGSVTQYGVYSRRQWIVAGALASPSPLETMRQAASVFCLHVF